jgi:hypothetical protein
MNLKTVPINVIGIGLLVSAGAMTYLFGYLPLQNAKRTNEEAWQRTEALAVNVKQNEKQNELIREEIELVHKRMESQFNTPADPDTPTIEMISNILEEHDIELENLKEDVAKHANGTKIDVQIRGTYENIVRVIYELRHMTLPARVIGLQLSSGRTDTGKLEARVQVELYPSQAFAA